MNFLAESIHFSIAAEALGMTILHSLWQGVALMFLLALFLRLGKSVSSGKRFIVAFASLLIFMLAFAGTFYQQWEDRAPTPVMALPAELPAEEVIIESSALESIASEQIIEVETSQWEVWRAQLSGLAPWLAWLWVAGSFLFALRLINGLVQSQRLRYRTRPIPANWQQRAEKLIQQLGISQSILLASSNRTGTPLTLGWLKPVILIPTSLLVMMPADQLETILIHELAHIKRRDYLWNLIQSMAEVVLFYHPAYWYISSVLERERELTCDALTVTVTQQPRIYAQALLQVAAQSAQVPLPSVAAAGKRGLSDRIQQIIYPGKVQRSISVLPFVLLLSLISLSLAAFSWYQPNLDLPSDELAADEPYGPVFTTQDGYGTMDSLFLEPLGQPDTSPIDYGPSFQEVMDGLSDEFLDTTNLTVDEMYQQALTIDQSLNQLSRNAARYRGDSLAESPVNYSAPSVVYLLDDEVGDPRQMEMSLVKGLEVFRAPFPPDLQDLVDREYSVVVRAVSRENKQNNTQGALRRPDYIGHGNLASQTIPLSRHLYFISNDGYLVGQNDFSQRNIDPKEFFRNSSLYLLDGEIVDDPSNIRLNAVRRFEVYYTPLPASLQNLADKGYSAVVRAFSREYQQADLRPFSTGGQITTRQEGNYQPVSGIKVAVKESGEQAITNEVGKFWLPATPEGTLVFYLPDDSPREVAIDGREFIDIITSTRKQRTSKYREKLLEQLTQRMSETALEKDKETIQQQINALDKAINSLQQSDTANTLTKTITGRVRDAFANRGIEDVLIKATDGTVAVTDEQGYYKIYLPTSTTDTEFEFTHPDYPTQHVEVDASLENEVSLSIDETGEHKAVIKNITQEGRDKILRERKVEGRVVDAETNELLQGVEIGWTTAGKKSVQARTNEQGEYQITLPKDIKVIEYSHPGYQERFMRDEWIIQSFSMTVTIKKFEDRQSEADKIIQGKVTDAKTGNPLPGINIISEGTNIGTVTDPQGNYSIKVVDPDARLAFKSLGYRDEIREVREQSRIDVELIELSPEEAKAQQAAISQQKAKTSAEFDEVPSSTTHSLTDQQVAQKLKSIDSVRREMGIISLSSPADTSILLVTGQVVDYKTGTPLPGVNIIIEGTNTGTVTDRDGKYSIQVPQGSSNLVFLSASSEQKTVPIKGKRIVDVELVPLSLDDPEHTLFVINGQVREDINTLDDLDINYYEIRQETPKSSLPPEYRNKGYTKMVRAVTRDFQAYLEDRNVLGKLIDADSKEPLVGAEITWVRKEGNVVLGHTNEQGEYQAKLPKDAKIIGYFHSGYTPHLLPDRFVTESFPMRLTLALEKNQIDKAAFENKLKVYPNPGSQREIRVEFTLEKAATIKFNFYSKEGRLVYDFKPLYLLEGDQNVALPTVHFPSDEYLLVIKINDGISFTRRVILE